MDDGTNREYSRTPEVEDLIRICRSLNEQGAKYLLIGGFAVILNGYVRGTKDIDFLIDASVENIQKIKQALSCLPDNAIALMQDDEVEKYKVVRIADEVVVDLMAKACGIDYAEASREVETKVVDGVPIPVAQKQLLIRTKDTVRPSDQVDVSYLRSIIEAEKKKK